MTASVRAPGLVAGARGGAAGGRRVDAYVARTQCSRPPSRRSRWNFTCASSASRIVRPCRTFTTNSCSYGTTCRRPATTQYAPGRQGPPASDPIARRPPNRRRRAECATREGASGSQTLPRVCRISNRRASDTTRLMMMRNVAAVKIKCVRFGGSDGRARRGSAECLSMVSQGVSARTRAPVPRPTRPRPASATPPRPPLHLSVLSPRPQPDGVSRLLVGALAIASAARDPSRKRNPPGREPSSYRFTKPPVRVSGDFDTVAA